MQLNELPDIAMTMTQCRNRRGDALDLIDLVRMVEEKIRVATKEECAAANGRFIPQAFGWMVHATTFSGNDLASIWHDDHMKHEHAMMGEPTSP